MTVSEAEVEDRDPDTIRPPPIVEEAKGNFDYTAFVDIEEINPTKFKMKHKDDHTQDVEISIEIEEEDEQVHWTGLTRAAEMFLEDFDFATKSKRPFVCLKMMLN